MEMVIIVLKKVYDFLVGVVSLMTSCFEGLLIFFSRELIHFWPLTYFYLIMSTTYHLVPSFVEKNKSLTPINNATTNEQSEHIKEDTKK